MVPDNFILLAALVSVNATYEVRAFRVNSSSLEWCLLHIHVSLTERSGRRLRKRVLEYECTSYQKPCPVLCPRILATNNIVLILDSGWLIISCTLYRWRVFVRVFHGEQMMSSSYLVASLSYVKVTERPLPAIKLISTLAS